MGQQILKSAIHAGLQDFLTVHSITLSIYSMFFFFINSKMGHQISKSTIHAGLQDFLIG